MPVDAQIALSLRQPHFATPADAMSLKDMMTRAQMNQLQLREAERQQQEGMSLRDLFRQPGMIDESTGAPSPQGLKGTYGIDPMTGMKMQAAGNQQMMLMSQLRNQGMQFQANQQGLDQKKVENLRGVLDRAVAAYDLAIQRKAPENIAQQAYQEAAVARAKELKDSGLISEEDFTKATTQLPPVDQARSGAMSLKDVTAQGERKIDNDRAMMLPIQKAQAARNDLEAQGKRGSREWKDLNELIAKEKAPTQMTMMAEHPLSIDTARMIAEQRVAGDTSATVGLARNPIALQMVNEEIQKIAKERNLKGADLAAFNAEYFGAKAGFRTAANRAANIDMAVTEAQNVAPLALQASAAVDRTKYPKLNDVLLAAEQGTGDEAVVKLAVATNSLINVYSRAIAPTGVATVSDKDHAREILSSAWSKGQYSAAVDMMMKEMAAARKSPGQVREALKSSVSGREEPEIKPPPSGDIPVTETELKQEGNDWIEYHNGKPVYKWHSKEQFESFKKASGLK